MSVDNAIAASDNSLNPQGNSETPLLTSTVTNEDELINVRLKKKNDFTGLKLKPRSYQTELYQKCLEQNCIIYLGTGLGKTYITVLYLNDPRVDVQIQNGKKVVFLAPTQDLIKQQADYINKHVRYRVKIFCGRSAHCGEHIDHWDKETWDSELRNVDLLFLTPQVFSAAIGTGHLDWIDFAAIIFDEFHHARHGKKKKSAGPAYYQILQSYHSFYSNRTDPIQWPKPRLIGLTASLINSMPKNCDAIRSEIAYLEKLIDGKCITNIEAQDKKPKFIIHTYDSLKVTRSNDVLTSLFDNFIKSIKEALRVEKINRLIKMQNCQISREDAKVLAFYNRIKLSASGFSIKPMMFTDVFEGLKNMRIRCGLWMLCEITHKLYYAVDSHIDSPYIPESMISIYKDFKEILNKIATALDNFLSSQKPDGGLVYHTRHKQRALLDALQGQYLKTGDDFSCIIFVASRLEVVALTAWLQNVSYSIPEYNFIKCDYAIGLSATMSSKYACITKRKPVEQYKMLDYFRKGLLNTIVTTSVLEEGIDLPVCSTVIRYNSHQDFRQYVQSKGRARQDVSSYVILCEKENYEKEEKDLNVLNDFEITLKRTLQSGDYDIATMMKETPLDGNIVDQPPTENEEDFFLNTDKSMRITSTIARTILHMYCSRLARRTPFTEGVRYIREKIESDTEQFQTTLYLPSGCPINEKSIKGGVKSEKLLADNSAIVAAVKALYEAGELNEYGAPTRATEANVDNLLASKNLEPKFDDLDERNLEGICVKEGDKELFLYRPAIRRESEYLFKNHTERVYKLIRLRFVSVDDSRQELQTFFEKSVFGLIVDASANLEFIPTYIHSHYGNFSVGWNQISNNLVIKATQDHDEYLNYTHRLLTNCLGFFNVLKDSFKRHCRFYVLPLNEENRPDLLKMRQSFRSSKVGQLKEGDIVKESMSSHFMNSRRRDYRGELMLVKKVHHEMNANSTIPNTRLTFAEYAQDKFNQDVEDENQPIIEVLPLSNDFGGSSMGSRREKQEFTTTNRYYLSQLLDRFDEDASCVLQSFLLPTIIYRLYITLTASQLDMKFREDTMEKRFINIEPVVQDQPLELDIHKSLIELEPINTNSPIDEPPDANQCDKEEPEESDVDLSEGDDDKHFYEFDSSSDFDTIASDDLYDEKDHEQLVNGPKYIEMLTRRCLEFNEKDDEDYHLKRWNLTEYQNNDIKVTEHTHHQSYWEDESGVYTLPFLVLDNQVKQIQARLVENIDKFYIQITSEDELLNEEEEFKRRTAQVDKSIEPPVKFDNGNAQPIWPGSRERGLIEAFTQRCAKEPYDLEILENIGDSYLKYTVSVVLFKSLNDEKEGFLTSARSRLTCNKYFCHLIRKKNFGPYAVTNSFSKEVLSYIFGRNFDNEDEERQFFNRMQPKQLADIFESIVGAYLMYQGEYEAMMAIEWLGLEIFDPSIFKELHENSIKFSQAPTAKLENLSSSMEYFYKSSTYKLRKFEDIINYVFKDSSYLVQAFTHASSLHKCTKTYERLEFLGDSILDFLVTVTLNKITKMKGAGQITESRSALVNNIAFAKLAMKYKFDLFIQHCNPDIYDELTIIRENMEEDPDMNFMDITDFDRIVKLLADTFESVAGAIYLDSCNSLDAVWSVYFPMIKETMDKEIEKPSKNLIALLYETFPGPKRVTFTNDDVGRTVDGQILTVTCRIISYDEYTEYREFEGSSISRRQAKMRAARSAMENAPDPEVRQTLDRLYLENRGIQRPRRRYRGQRGGRGNRGHNSRGGGSRNLPRSADIE